jgi:hypothetical protein
MSRRMTAHPASLRVVRTLGVAWEGSAATLEPPWSSVHPRIVSSNLRHLTFLIGCGTTSAEQPRLVALSSLPPPARRKSVLSSVAHFGSLLSGPFTSWGRAHTSHLSIGQVAPSSSWLKLRRESCKKAAPKRGTSKATPARTRRRSTTSGTPQPSEGPFAPSTASSTSSINIFS